MTTYELPHPGGDLLCWSMRPPAWPPRPLLPWKCCARPTSAGDSFRLVLTDAHMPEMDGFTPAEQLILDTARNSAARSSSCSAPRPAGRRCPLRADGDCRLLEQTDQAIRVVRRDHAGPGRARRRRTSPCKPRLPTTCRGSALCGFFCRRQPGQPEVATALLESHGHRVIVVANGREAVATLRSQPFDLVLMDVQMPEMDGLEATEAIRARERQTGGHIPIIAMTAHAGRRPGAMSGCGHGCVYLQTDPCPGGVRGDHDVAESARSTQAAAVRVLPAEEAFDWTDVAAVRGDARLRMIVAQAAVRKLGTCWRRTSPGGWANQDATALRLAAHTCKGSARS